MRPRKIKPTFTPAHINQQDNCWELASEPNLLSDGHNVENSYEFVLGNRGKRELHLGP